MTIEEHLKGLGYKTDGVHQRSHYGWETTALKGKLKLRLILQYAGTPWLLTVEPLARWTLGLRAQAGVVDAGLNEIRQQLARDTDIQNPIWQTRNEYMHSEEK